MTDPRSLARRYLDQLWNRADAAAIPTLLAADVVGHANGVTLHGHETFRARMAALHGAYATARFTADDVIAEGDRVVIRWSFAGAHRASGRAVQITGMNVFRIAGGKIAELWVNADDLGELEQQGALTIPRAS